MAKTYTYDDFMKALEESGLGEQFSQADLNLARQNPDAGMSLISYKTDYKNATTDELRALANQGAESVRSSYGGYTGGGDGGSFKLNPMSPNQFSYGDAPTWDDNWAGRIDEALNAQMNRQPYSYAGQAPTYESRYDPQIQDTIAGILGRGEFSYDPKTDPVYSAYQKQYAREGQRATANAMGEAAAMTGGMPSSWAMTAASQAGDYYASQMADKIPELYKDAYNRYLQEYQMKLSDLSALRGLESDDYAKYQDQLSQYNADRSFDYGTWLDQQKLAQQDVDTLRALRSDDMDLYKTKLGQYNTDRSFDYGQWLDEISNQRTVREDERNWAGDAAKYGDYSRLNALGINTAQAEYDDALARASERAKVGDYSGYEALGIDASTARAMEALERQAKEAQIASTYANMPTEEDRALERAYQQAQIDKLYRDTSSGTTGTAGPSASNLVAIMETALKAGDMDTYYQAASMLGMTPDMGGIEGKQTADEAAANAKSFTFAGMGTAEVRAELEDRIAFMMDQRAAGNEAYSTREKMKQELQKLKGYKKKDMDSIVDELLDQAFSQDRNKYRGAGGTKRRGIVTTPIPDDTTPAVPVNVDR